MRRFDISQSLTDCWFMDWEGRCLEHVQSLFARRSLSGFFDTLLFSLFMHIPNFTTTIQHRLSALHYIGGSFLREFIHEDVDERSSFY